MKRTALILLILLLLSAGARAQELDLFVWRAEDLDVELCVRTGFTRVLMQYTSEGLPVDEIEGAGLSLCLLDGGPEWGGSDMVALVEKAAELSIPCAVLDCEGWYTQQSPTEERFTRFVDRVCAAHEAAGRLGVRLSVCIPYWTEKVSRTQLKRLIREGCDEIIVMDYDDEKLVENLSTEVRYCARYGKACQVALLIRPPWEDEGEQESAYWAGGMPALQEAFDRIRAEYGDEVGFSVHHAGFLSEFLAQDGE